MYLMYYLNEDGKRVYTLKVRKLCIASVSLLLVCRSFVARFWRRLFFSPLEHPNFDREFIVTKFTPRRPLFFSLYVLNRKRVRMGNRRCRRTRRDSRRTISSRNRESRAKNGSGYFSRSNRRNSFKSIVKYEFAIEFRGRREKET